MRTFVPKQIEHTEEIASEESVEDFSDMIQILTGIPLTSDSLISDVLISDDNELFIYKYRVMFGYRLRAGFVDKMHLYSELDICCGNDAGVYSKLLKQIIDILGNTDTSQDPFQSLPMVSKIKPYYKDEEFCKILDDKQKQINKQKQKT